MGADLTPKVRGLREGERIQAIQGMSLEDRMQYCFELVDLLEQFAKISMIDDPHACQLIRQMDLAYREVLTEVDLGDEFHLKYVERLVRLQSTHRPWGLETNRPGIVAFETHIENVCGPLYQHTTSQLPDESKMLTEGQSTFDRLFEDADQQITRTPEEIRHARVCALYGLAHKNRTNGQGMNTRLLNWGFQEELESFRLPGMKLVMEAIRYDPANQFIRGIAGYVLGTEALSYMMGGKETSLDDMTDDQALMIFCIAVKGQDLMHESLLKDPGELLTIDHYFCMTVLQFANINLLHHTHTQKSPFQKFIERMTRILLNAQDSEEYAKISKLANYIGGRDFLRALKGQAPEDRRLYIFDRVVTFYYQALVFHQQRQAEDDLSLEIEERILKVKGVKASTNRTNVNRFTPAFLEAMGMCQTFMGKIKDPVSAKFVNTLGRMAGLQKLLHNFSSAAYVFSMADGLDYESQAHAQAQARHMDAHADTKSRYSDAKKVLYDTLVKKACELILQNVSPVVPAGHGYGYVNGGK